MKSEKILLEGKEYYIDINAYENPQNIKLFLFKDPALLKIAKTNEGKTLMVFKDHLNEILKESGMAGGAGYAIWGGGGGYYGNPGRGIGFGQSSNKGGPNLMYTYDIKPLDQKLQQPPTPQDGTEPIYIGCKIRGKILGKNKWIKGNIADIKRDDEGNLLAYIIKDQSTAKNIKIDPTSAEILKDEMDGGIFPNKPGEPTPLLRKYYNA
jgi:hypothetical protein